jgi:hypothetical protein
LYFPFLGDLLTQGKCIVLLLDGTWNDSEAGSADTNIVRLRELIVASLDQDNSPSPQDDIVAKRRTFDGRPVELYYDRGVGTGGFLDKYLGGALGAGLERGVRRAYRFLANTYDTDDEVYIFGFSRGAYTARSLAGFIASAGLLRRRANDAINESRAWDYYRTSPKDRLQPVASHLRGLSHEVSSPLITCLGVFDTVGARGIPIRWFWRENRDLYEFHDVELSTISRINLHALALDEHRDSFQAAIWRKPKFVDISSVTEQVWFVGAHADIGGGYISSHDRFIDVPGREQVARRCLDDISLDWMIKRVKKHNPNFPLRDSALLLGRNRKPIDGSWALDSALHEARRTIYRAFPFAWRSVGNSARRFGAWSRRRFVSYDRHASPIGEMVHISALERWGKTLGWAKRSYEPPNLNLALNRIRETYSNGAKPDDPLYVVGWCGHRLEPSNDESCATVQGFIELAMRRESRKPARGKGAPE